MPKLTYPKAKRALTALNALYDCVEDLTEQEREDLELAANAVRAICDRIPDPAQ
ncbi:hypothetical protein [Streptomyces sp. NE06-03C]|uniref:hypothetical protein n=1 Tax=Streptomyces sp. NE06-03C TaxID=3028694 RepID=UPI0029A3FED5|nr:hypothetical protein [Streptomyces sp. NE06-03C]MDX2922549.1 hypothetical protein [Streptomyces sp. NE06-03C]